MTFIEQIQLMERIDSLIRRRATGTPKEISMRINISERHLYNIISKMKSLGAPINYCYQTKTYYYQEKVAFQVGFTKVQDDEMKVTFGGHEVSRAAFDNLDSYYDRNDIVAAMSNTNAHIYINFSNRN